MSNAEKKAEKPRVIGWHSIDSKCPKCESLKVMAVWYATEIDKQGGGTDREQLDCECLECAHKWKEPVPGKEVSDG